MKRQRVFRDINGNWLKIRYRRSAIILEHTCETVKNKWGYNYEFTSKMEKVILRYLQVASDYAWKSIKHREADSCLSDYWEYYDTEHDSNGYLILSEKEIFKLLLEKPCTEDKRLYQFNKRRFESFMYDIGLREECLK